MAGLAEPLVQRAFCEADGRLRAVRQAAGDAHGGLHQLIAGHGHADQPDALGLLAIQEIAREQVVFSLGHAAQQRPDDRGVVAGSDAQADVSVGNAGVLGGDGDVGHQGHRQAGAHGDPVDGGDDRLVQVQDVVDDVAGLFGVLGDDGGVVDGLLDHLEVAAGRESIAGAGDHGHPHLGVGADVQPDTAELVMQPEVRGVQGLRAVHREGDDPVGLFDEQVLV